MNYREEIIAAMQIPVIMGRGKPVGLVIGADRLTKTIDWAAEHDPRALECFRAVPMKVLGLEVIVPDMHRNILFAYTAAERDKVRKNLEIE